ncbi:MAG: hypothetical protein MK078_16315 [Crocinitomicaceae bacterium]|nr:hypothetical protein [Crocinitomicaceae bacterium]
MSETEERELLELDLQKQVYTTIDSVTRARTGFEGEIIVNSATELEKYLE